MTERDEQRGVFWAHLQLALELVGAVATDALQPMFPDSADVDALADQLLQLEVPVVLVIDAAERLSGQVVFDQLARLLQCADDRLHLLMTTRVDPPLPLHRYRVEGGLAEIRPDELALTGTEVGEVLALHELGGSESLTTEVLRRTEGWAAGVRLAALRLRAEGRDAPLNGFAGDYLRAEVLARLAPEERDLLARISVVDELPAGLAAVLGERPDADDLVRHLSSVNAFVHPTRGPPGGFRVHPLVRELTIADLEVSAPGRTTVLHRRASEWFEAEGRLEPAVRHAAAAGDWERAAALVVEGEGFGDVVLGTTTGDALLGQLAHMPDRDAADVLLLRAASAIGGRELQRAAADTARSLVEAQDDRRVLAAAVVTTALHDAAGRPLETLRAAQEARTQLAISRGSPGLDLLKAAVARAEGAAQLRAGDLDAACTALTEALSTAATADGPFRARCLAELSLAEAGRGHLSRAWGLADAAEREAAEQEGPADACPCAAELARAWVTLERQDLTQAQRSLDRVGRLGLGPDDEAWHTVTTLLRARLMRDRGEQRRARRLLERTVNPPGWLGEHLVAEAAAVGVLVARQEPDGDSGRTPPTKLTGSTPIRCVQDLLDRADHRSQRGISRSAKADIAEALTMAREEQLRRPFAHATPRVLAMVRADPALYAKAEWLRPEESGMPSRGAMSDAAPAAVREALSPRELEVLRNLSALLTTEEIAATMFISVNTVRTHVRRILQKLAVSRRHDAVRRARALGLV